MCRWKVHDLDLWTLTVVRTYVTTDKVALPHVLVRHSLLRVGVSNGYI